MDNVLTTLIRPKETSTSERSTQEDKSWKKMRLPRISYSLAILLLLAGFGVAFYSGFKFWYILVLGFPFLAKIYGYLSSIFFMDFTFTLEDTMIQEINDDLWR